MKVTAGDTGLGDRQVSDRVRKTLCFQPLDIGVTLIVVVMPSPDLRLHIQNDWSVVHTSRSSHVIGY